MRRIAFVLALASTLAAAPANAADPDPWFGTDKALHFGVSAGIAAGGYAIGTTVLDARGHALLLGGGLSLAAGTGKELLDLAGYGSPSWKDFTWDVIGTLAGLAVAWSLDLVIRGVERPPLLSAPRATSSALRLAF